MSPGAAASGRADRPYGFWDSPVQAHHLTQSTRLADVAWDSDGRTLVWLEGRGPEGVVVAQSEEQPPRDLTSNRSVRARVNYGGGDFAVRDGKLYFVDAGGQLFAQNLAGGTPLALTLDGYIAAPTIAADCAWLVCVHRSEDDTDRLLLVDASARQPPRELVSGADFYLQPALHPRDEYLAWIEWDHPDMPWDSTRLVLARLQPGAAGPALTGCTTLAGCDDAAGRPAAALFQPQFSPDGRYLAYVSDQSGWSNLYLYDLESGRSSLVFELEAELAEPAWIHGQRVYAFGGDDGDVYFTQSHLGSRRLYRTRLGDGAVEAVPEMSAYTSVQQVAAHPSGGVAAIVSSSRQPARVVSLCEGVHRVHTVEMPESMAIESLACAEAVSWTAADGTEVHGLYYPPSSATCTACGTPPLLVHIHGGPTGQADVGFDAELQYFATRGYAVLSVNHRGSTGYGRVYRTSLQGNWGVYDVEDAVGGARHLVAADLADAGKLAIMGSSAGGYTVLRTLTVHPGFFRAAVCRYGISDLSALARETHKFELRYLDSLLGSLPEASEIYRERSPLFSADRICDPVALFCGADDEVVPRSQSDAIVNSLRQRQVPCEYHVYTGEGHGFRKPETQQAYINAAEEFLKTHLLSE